MESQATTEDDTSEEAPADQHLDGVADGCGCTEIWEHLSERRAADD
jgi:hypothetical protein